MNRATDSWCRQGLIRPLDLLRNVFVHDFRLAAAFMLVLWLAGCGDSRAVNIKLHARPLSSDALSRLAVQAQVTGPMNGLKYKWFSVSGRCDPQESDSPETVFQFAENIVKDRVTVEVWRDGERIAEAGVDVKFDEELANARKKQPPETQIEIIHVPPYEQGGPDTRAGIAGKVSGKVTPECRVVLYARAYNSWHLQPTINSMHVIHPDNTWTSWTHTGTSYAALLVRPEFDALVRLDMLPQVGGYVLARTIVDGKR